MQNISPYNRYFFSPLFVLICLGSVSSAATKKPLGKNWPESEFVSFAKISHNEFDRLLKKHVNETGYVNYREWKASSSDRQALKLYLANLSRANPQIRTSKKARIAFWINAYNAVTIEGILQVYPTSSIRNHTANFLGYNIWKDLPLRVGKQSYSLHEIEHNILRQQNEPRIHFAIVCASIGCPRLSRSAYHPKKLDKQLSTNTIHFFSQSDNLKFDFQHNKIYLSSILDWYSTEFGSTQSERLKYLSPYFPKAQIPFHSNSATEVHYLKYNWGLNDQAKVK